MPWIRRVRTSQPLDANVGLIDGGLFSKNSVALALNFAGGSRPIQTAGKSLAWSGSTSATTAGTPQGVGLYDPSTSSGLGYGASRSFDGFSPANSPCFFALSFVYGAYVNQGSGANVLWTYGGSGGTGFYVRSSSTNVLTVQFVNKILATPALVAGKPYHLVGGRDAAGNCWLWLNGDLVASGTGATGADSASSNAIRFLDDNAGNRTFKGSISGFILSSANPLYFGKELSANPWQAYEPELVWVPVSAGGGNTASLTGQAATSGHGALTPSLDLALGGNSASTSAGTITSSVSGIFTAALTGSEVVTAPGTPVAGISLALSGNVAIASQGTVTSSLGTAVAISGQAATASQGTPVAALSLALTGNEVATSAGLLSASTSGGTITVALTGNEAVASSGLLTPPAEFFSVSGGGIKQHPRKPLPSEFEEELKAPTVKLKKSAVPAFTTQTFVPYAKMGVPKALFKALGEVIAVPLSAPPREALPPEYDDDDIPDEVIMLALQ